MNLKKLMSQNPELLKGQTREEIISIFGNGHLPEQNGSILVYIIGKTLLNRKGIALILDFDENGKVEKFLKIKND